MDRIQVLEPGLRRLVAPNPSPMTGRGTNTYILGHEEVVIIDPGPDDPAHLDAILAAARGAPIARILVTHAHLDHSALARRLADRTSAPVAAFGDCRSGRSDAMQGLERIGGGEGLDHAFAPDEILPDGAELSGRGWQVQAMWSPGHLGNHLTFLWNDAAFCGDLVMAWSTSLVSPPDGDLTQFMASCRALACRRPRILYPGHGDAIDEPQKRIDTLVAHRVNREREILSALAIGPASARQIARSVYTDLRPGLLPAAERNVMAHLIDLTGRSLVQPLATPSPATHYIRK